MPGVARVRAVGVIALGLGLTVAACGAGDAARAVRPEAPTAAAAIDGVVCKSVEKRGAPLVVDWLPEQRVSLEVAMKNGGAVVAYDCKEFRLLEDCKVDEPYTFVASPRSRRSSS